MNKPLNDGFVANAPTLRRRNSVTLYFPCTDVVPLNQSRPRQAQKVDSLLT